MLDVTSPNRSRLFRKITLVMLHVLLRLHSEETQMVHFRGTHRCESVMALLLQSHETEMKKLGLELCMEYVRCCHEQRTESCFQWMTSLKWATLKELLTHLALAAVAPLRFINRLMKESRVNQCFSRSVDLSANLICDAAPEFGRVEDLIFSILTELEIASGVTRDERLLHEFRCRFFSSLQNHVPESISFVIASMCISEQEPKKRYIICSPSSDSSDDSEDWNRTK